jgi:hypothetical protein
MHGLRETFVLALVGDGGAGPEGYKQKSSRNQPVQRHDALLSRRQPGRESRHPVDWKQL